MSSEAANKTSGLLVFRCICRKLTRTPSSGSRISCALTSLGPELSAEEKRKGSATNLSPALQPCSCDTVRL